MANIFQTKLIKEGVSKWNEWRLNNPEIQIDLSGLDLSGLNLVVLIFTY